MPKMIPGQGTRRRATTPGFSNGSNSRKWLHGVRDLKPTKELTEGEAC
jgi:hypothetical protein